MTILKTKCINLIYVLIVLIACLLLAAPVLGCGGASPSGSEKSGPPAQSSDEADKDPDSRYEIPAYKDVIFSEDAAEGNEETAIDISHISEGYFGVWADSDSRLKLQVLKDESTFTYDLVSGKTDFFPIQAGNGEYYIRVMKNMEESKYFELYSVTVGVTLENEFAPYLVANQYADYTKDSECVKLAKTMAGEASDVHDFISRVYDYVTENIVYDYDKANTVQSGYTPIPDDTLRSGNGICFDYASLAASMLRSQGVPTKIIFGYVAPDDLYHAWNMFYTEDEGWVTVEFKANSKDWTRMDLTFAANGSDSTFIGDGSNYTDIYQY